MHDDYDPDANGIATPMTEGEEEFEKKLGDISHGSPAVTATLYYRAEKGGEDKALTGEDLDGDGYFGKDAITNAEVNLGGQFAVPKLAKKFGTGTAHPAKPQPHATPEPKPALTREPFSSSKELTVISDVENATIIDGGKVGGFLSQPGDKIHLYDDKFRSGNFARASEAKPSISPGVRSNVDRDFTITDEIQKKLGQSRLLTPDPVVAPMPIAKPPAGPPAVGISSPSSASVPSVPAQSSSPFQLNAHKRSVGGKEGLRGYEQAKTGKQQEEKDAKGWLEDKQALVKVPHSTQPQPFGNRADKSDLGKEEAPSTDAPTGNIADRSKRKASEQTRRMEPATASASSPVPAPLSLSGSVARPINTSPGPGQQQAGGGQLKNLSLSGFTDASYTNGSETPKSPSDPAGNNIGFAGKVPPVELFKSETESIERPLKMQLDLAEKISLQEEITPQTGLDKVKESSSFLRPPSSVLLERNVETEERLREKARIIDHAQLSAGKGEETKGLSSNEGKIKQSGTSSNRPEEQLLKQDNKLMDIGGEIKKRGEHASQGPEKLSVITDGLLETNKKEFDTLAKGKKLATATGGITSVTSSRNQPRAKTVFIDRDGNTNDGTPLKDTRSVETKNHRGTKYTALSDEKSNSSLRDLNKSLEKTEKSSEALGGGGAGTNGKKQKPKVSPRRDTAKTPINLDPNDLQKGSDSKTHLSDRESGQADFVAGRQVLVAGLTPDDFEIKSGDDDVGIRIPVRLPDPKPEVVTAEAPYSTFSLNVSDASFRLCQANLLNGQIPAPHVVRAEEFINAFDYRDPAPAKKMPLAFAWERSRHPFAHNRDLVRFSIQTAAEGRQGGQPLNLVLAIDNSGSMERADRVAILREALKVLSTKLRANDTLSVIAFSRTPRLWLDGLKGETVRAKLSNFNGLVPQGGTNIESALDLGYATALKHFIPGGNNRVILLTDGAANLGAIIPKNLVKKVEGYRKQGVALDCFGIGWDGYNDHLMEALARNGDGRYAFLNSATDIERDFGRKLAGALTVSAADIKVQVVFNPARVTTHRQVGYLRHQLKKEDFQNNTVDAAEIGAAESGNAIYVLQINDKGTGPLGKVHVRYREPVSGQYKEMSWPLPYRAKVPVLAEASPSLRLAASAATFAEWLGRSPFAADVDPSVIQKLLNGLEQSFPSDSPVKAFQQMVVGAHRLMPR
jgi:Mg-chelatase subunit ChlD